MAELASSKLLILKAKMNDLVPQRVLLSVFGFLAIVNAYNMRLSIDIVSRHEMPKRNKEATPKERLMNYLSSLFPDIAARTAEKGCSGPFDWSERMQNCVLAGFFVGYSIGHVPAGRLAEKYGGKRVLEVGILAAAVLTLLTPTAVKVGGPVALIVMRFLIGLSESVTYPALCVLLAKWVPARERGKLGALVLSGSQAGVFVANFTTTLLMRWFDWAMVFYFFGCCALLWVALFAQFCHSDPETHPCIKEQEKEYLRAEIKSLSADELSGAPWKAILTNVPMWALASATIQYDWLQYASLSNVPTLMVEAKNETIQENLLSSASLSMPYILRWLVSLLSGIAVDFLITHNVLTTSGARKVMTSIAGFGPQIFDGVVSCFSCNQQRNEGFFTRMQCAFGVVGTYYAGIKLTPLDLSPNYAGTLMSIANGLGSITALLQPHWHKLEAGDSTRKLQNLLWVVCTALLSGEVQPFNDSNAAEIGNISA